ncbi:hypothetical protein KR059_012932 [Drosophila kikkawai]|nr:hypothetical protein KR059_012932 [Drosophila kikkawai]
MTKWGLSFDGTTDPLGFIEHIEERADTCRIDRRYLAQARVVLLSGRAESWFRTSGLQQASWVEVRREFLDFFLPPRYYQRLEDEIRTHLQLPNEPFKEYLVDLRLQMRRAGFSPDRELERVYDNILPEYQLFTRRQDFRTLAELTHLVVDYEVTRSRNGGQDHRSPSPRQEARLNYGTEAGRTPRRAPPAAPVGNPFNGGTSRNANTSQSTASLVPPEPVKLRDACRNCGQPGHFSAECRNPRVIFCWDCGRRGTRTIDCCRRAASGNGNGPRVTGNHPGNPSNPRSQ